MRRRSKTIPTITGRKGHNPNKAFKKDKVKKDKTKNAVFAAESAEGTAGSGIEITIRVNR